MCIPLTRVFSGFHERPSSQAPLLYVGEDSDRNKSILATAKESGRYRDALASRVSGHPSKVESRVFAVSSGDSGVARTDRLVEFQG